MAKVVMVNSVQNTQPDVIQKFYDAPSSSSGGKGTEILAFTASNNTTASATYKAYIFDASGDPIEAVVPQKIVVRDRFDLGPSSIGQLIPPGGSLQMESSTANSIAFRITGNEL